MPDLTRRPDPHRAHSWLVYYGDVHVGTISKGVGNPGAAEAWQWLCGFYPGSNPGDQRGDTAGTFDQARAAGNPGAEPQWKWLCGFYPGTNPGEQRGGTAGTFDQTRDAFEAAWRVYLPKRSEALA